MGVRVLVAVRGSAHKEAGGRRQKSCACFQAGAGWRVVEGRHAAVWEDQSSREHGTRHQGNAPRCANAARAPTKARSCANGETQNASCVGRSYMLGMLRVTCHAQAGRDSRRSGAAEWTARDETRALHRCACCCILATRRAAR